MSDLDTGLARMRAYECRAIADTRRVEAAPPAPATFTDLDGQTFADRWDDLALPHGTRVRIHTASIHCTVRDGHGTIVGSEVYVDAQTYRVRLDRPYVQYRPNDSDALVTEILIERRPFDVLHRPA